MTADAEQESLRDALVETALAAVCNDRVDVASAGTTLLAAAAVLIALLPESEWSDFLGDAWALMPNLVALHARRFEQASIDLGRMTVQ